MAICHVYDVRSGTRENHGIYFLVLEENVPANTLMSHKKRAKLSEDIGQQFQHQNIKRLTDVSMTTILGFR